MTTKPTKRWYIDMPWGKLALISWGDPSDPPVLMVHGWMDTAATFMPLLEHLPESYFYVSLDLPGHGLSDHYSPGILPSQIHIVEVLRRVVDHMNWRKFIYLGHSQAFSIGVLYYSVFPGQISKMINLDPGPPIGTYYVNNFLDAWYKYFYGIYYGEYKRYNHADPKLYTYEEAINAVVRSRHITEEQAEIVLSRSLISLGNGKYRLAYDQKMRKMTPLNIPNETFYTLISTNTPPMLNLLATEDVTTDLGKEWKEKVMTKMNETRSDYLIVYVKGGHDFHITDPEVAAEPIKEFLDRNFETKSRSKL